MKKFAKKLKELINKFCEQVKKRFKWKEEKHLIDIEELKAEAIKWVNAIRNKEILKIDKGFMRILDDKTGAVVCRVLMKKNNLTEEDLK